MRNRIPIFISRALPLKIVACAGEGGNLNTESSVGDRKLNFKRQECLKEVFIKENNFYTTRLLIRK